MADSLSDAFLEQLRDACPIEEIVGQYVNMKPLGSSRAVGLCPFHIEKSPSFVVYSHTQSFYCFGCQIGGDVVSFVKRIENLDYIGTLKFLAEKAGIPFPSHQKTDFPNTNAKLIQINREAAKFFYKSLKESAEAIAYLREKRHLHPSTIVKFGIGFAPNNWHSLEQHLHNGLGFETKQLLEARLLAVGKSNSTYDVFRNRIIFPIRNTKSEIVGFGGRVLDESQPKYLNSQDSTVFKKRDNLFNINLAKNSKKIILVEGYLDAISIVQAGFENVVATLGTAITTNQAKLLSFYANEVVLAYDSDTAGKLATAKAINILNEAGIATKVLDLLEFKDPDEYIKKRGTVRFGNAVSASVDALDFKLNSLKARFDLAESAGKAAFLKAAAELFAQINNGIVREVYLSKTSAELGVDKQVIAAYTEKLRKINRKKDDTRKQRDTQKNLTVGVRTLKQIPVGCIKSEELIICSLYNDPQLLELLRSRCPAEIFPSPNKDIYKLLLIHLENERPVNISTITQQNESALQQLSGILARNCDCLLDKRGVLECVDTLRRFYTQEQVANISDMSAEELKQHFENISNCKKS
ncbi:MAG: DNA primase [Oscillospiraceae bacterium]|jgi:DNA primase|nr:DNA primase [Oscillospiraceae bacterium]